MSDRYPQRTAAEFRGAIVKYRGNRTRLTHLLFAAIHARRMPAIQAILAEGVSVDAIDPTEPVPGLTPQSIRRPTTHGLCALAIAGRMGGNANDLKIAEWLLDQGASAAGPGTVLLCRVELLPRLLEGGADINARGEDYNPLFFAIKNRTKQDKSVALIEAGADLTGVDTQGFTPLHAAIKNGRRETAEALLKAGADRFALDLSGRSPFRLGVESLAGLHFQTESDIRATRSILRSLRDELPAQPEDIFLAALAFDDSSALSSVLGDSSDSINQTLPGPAGYFVPKVDVIAKIKEEGLIAGIDETYEFVEDCGTPWPLLSWAVLLDAPKCIRWMIQAGADPEIEIPGLPTPRLLASKCQAKDSVHKALASNGL
ncbi:MAG: ankyrin repeat domain-containing protein [Planctomycetota bacterium]